MGKGEIIGLVEGDRREYKQEFQVCMVAPDRSWNKIEIPVSKGHGEQALLTYQTFNDEIRSFLVAVIDRRGSAGGEVNLESILIGMQNDANFAGYGNIFRAICSLIPHLVNCRFFITEGYNTWIDEYRISDGNLGFERRKKLNALEPLLQSLERIVMDNPGDEALKELVVNKLVGPYEEFTTEDWESYFSMEIEVLLGRASVLDPTASKLLRIHARMYKAIREYSKASGYVDILLKKGHLDAIFLKYILCCAQNNFSGVINGLYPVICSDTEPGYSEKYLLLVRMGIHLLRAYSHRKMGNPLSADDEMRKYLQMAAIRTERRITTSEMLFEELFYTGHFAEIAVFYVSRDKDLTGDFEGNGHALAIDLLDWGRFASSKINDTEDAEVRSRYVLMARDCYKKALEFDDCKGEAHFRLSMLADDGESAIDWWRQAAEVNPAHPGALVKLGENAYHANQYEPAIGYFSRYLAAAGELYSAMQNWSGMEDLLCYQCSPYWQEFYKGRLADCYYESANRLLHVQGRHHEAGLCYDAIFELYPALNGDPRILEGALLGKSDISMFCDEPQEALDYSEKALSVNPKSACAWSAKGNCLNNLGRYGEALPCFEQAILYNKDYWHSYYCKAYALTQMGGKEEDIFWLIRKARELESGKAENCP